MRFLTILIASLLVINSFAQKKLPRGVNTWNEKEFSPSISADNRSLCFVRKYAMGGRLMMYESQQIQSGVWSRPAEIEFFTKLSTLSYVSGYSLTADGNQIYFSCRKSPGIGKYDIWYSEKKNGKWGEPTNFYKPLNSEGNDVCPSLTTDNKTMYYVKGKKETNGIISGDIYISTKKGNSWTLAKKLNSSSINTGNETQPKILSDNKTLIFASNRPGGKGGFDLYMSVLEDGEWSAPVNLEFINTSGDDIDFSVPGKGNIAYFSKISEKENLDIYMAKIPGEFQQKKISLLKGKITGTKARVITFDAETNKLISKTETDEKGNYFLTLTEGKLYDVCFYPKDKNYSFSSILVDSREQEKFKRIQNNINLQKIEIGTSMFLNNVNFVDTTTILEKYSLGEINRLTKLLQANSDKNITIKCYYKSELENNEVTDSTTSIIERQLGQSIQNVLIEKGISIDRLKIENIPFSEAKVEVLFE